MNRSDYAALAVAFLVLMAPAATSVAQTSSSYKCFCQTAGTDLPEPLGDHEGHAVTVTSYTCRVEGGALDGGVLTGTSMYEWDRTNARGLSGNGVGRKAGAMLVYQLGDFKNELILADGKVSGFLASGQGTYKLATGSAASLAGKTFTYTARRTGSNQFDIDVKVE